MTTGLRAVVARTWAAVMGSVMAQRNGRLVLIPGTKHIDYLEENTGAGKIALSSSDLDRLDQLINGDTVRVSDILTLCARPPMTSEDNWGHRTQFASGRTAKWIAASTVPRRSLSSVYTAYACLSIEGAS